MAILAAIITTIQPPTAAIESLVARLLPIGAELIVAGDKKGPAQFDLKGVQFLSLQDQLDSPYELARKLPTGHYARKNVGYLAAIAAGAGCLYETDDDNAPLPSWERRVETVEAIAAMETGWVNVYCCFSPERIWPRGFPLDAVVESCAHPVKLTQTPRSVRAPIQQGLANHSPDVDAIWRLTLDRPFNFEGGPSILLPPGAWCPFNSQSTWWWPEAYPLLYLPSYCSFRMTDIWRSFIAQRCLWEMGHGVVFHASEVFQERNEHDLMRDFNDEIPGYQRNRELVTTLERICLEQGANVAGANLLHCYETLVDKGFFPEKELELVRAWLTDLRRVGECLKR